MPVRRLNPAPPAFGFLPESITTTEHALFTLLLPSCMGAQGQLPNGQAAGQKCAACRAESAKSGAVKATSGYRRLAVHGNGGSAAEFRVHDSVARSTPVRSHDADAMQI